MTLTERRQARWLVRTAQEMERHVFELIELVQLADHGDDKDCDWRAAYDHLLRIQDMLSPLFVLVNNVEQEKNGKGFR